MPRKPFVPGRRPWSWPRRWPPVSPAAPAAPPRRRRRRRQERRRRRHRARPPSRAATRPSPRPAGCPRAASSAGMLPGDGQPLSGTEAQKVYDGQADVTYDTDRRVGCRWKRATTARHPPSEPGLRARRLVRPRRERRRPGAGDLRARRRWPAQIPSGGAGSPSPAAPAASAYRGDSKGKDKGDRSRHAATASGQRQRQRREELGGREGEGARPGAPRHEVRPERGPEHGPEPGPPPRASSTTSGRGLPQRQTGHQRTPASTATSRWSSARRT